MPTTPNARTRGLIATDELTPRQPAAYLINPARGHFVNEIALYDALRKRAIADAAIDTWHDYPQDATDQPRPSTVPLWNLPNVIMMPHHSGAKHGAATRSGMTVAANIDRLRRRQPLTNVITKLSWI